jgi:hypothetical protein
VRADAISPELRAAAAEYVGTFGGAMQELTAAMAEMSAEDAEALAGLVLAKFHAPDAPQDSQLPEFVEVSRLVESRYAQTGWHPRVARARRCNVRHRFRSVGRTRERRGTSGGRRRGSRRVAGTRAGPSADEPHQGEDDEHRPVPDRGRA